MTNETPNAAADPRPADPDTPRLRGLLRLAAWIFEAMAALSVGSPILLPLLLLVHPPREMSVLWFVVLCISFIVAGAIGCIANLALCDLCLWGARAVDEYRAVRETLAELRGRIDSLRDSIDALRAPPGPPHEAGPPGE